MADDRPPVGATEAVKFGLLELDTEYPQAKPNDVPKPRWQRFLESAGGAALITVFIGGYFGNVISASVQEKIKAREFQQSWLQTQGNQALTYYKEHLTEQQAIVKATYEVVGACISASEDLIILTRPEFDLDRYSQKDKPMMQKQKQDIRQQFNDCDRRWRGERETWGLLMSFYHHGRPEVGKAWANLSTDLTEFMQCAREWNVAHPGAVSKDLAHSACEESKARLRSNLDVLSDALESAQTYAWEGWESPEKLKVLLAK